MRPLAKRIYILMIKVDKFCFSSRYFLKEIENVFSVVLSRYGNTPESLRELEKAVEALAYKARVPKVPLLFLLGN